MSSYLNKSIVELNEIKEALLESYKQFKMQNLNLDMSRGKPCKEQLDISNDMLMIDINESSIDLRNYGGIDGITEVKKLFASILEVSENEVIISGNSSLSLMHDSVMRALLLGVYGGYKPWSHGKVKFLCPSPGYDRHFSICELFGIEMIPIEINRDGPNIAKIRELVENDDSIKGIWCIPKYSNPTGITYSDEIVSKMARLKPKAKDFRIFWDNAYVVHHLDNNKKDKLKNILEECKKANNEDIVYIFSSTSKITYAGSGISVLAASTNNIKFIKNQLSIQTIGPDKINQYRHFKFLKSTENIEKHMEKHAHIIRPKFEKVIEILDIELNGLEIADWTNPNGGYFISFNSLDGCAKNIVTLALEAGVKLTEAGATYPYKNDQYDKNIRIAPTFPPIEELEKAMELFCVCVKLACINKIIQDRIN